MNHEKSVKKQSKGEAIQATFSVALLLIAILRVVTTETQQHTSVLRSNVVALEKRIYEACVVGKQENSAIKKMTSTKKRGQVHC